MQRKLLFKVGGLWKASGKRWLSVATKDEEEFATGVRWEGELEREGHIEERMNKTWEKDLSRLVDATQHSYRDNKAMEYQVRKDSIMLVFWEKESPVILRNKLERENCFCDCYSWSHQLFRASIQSLSMDFLRREGRTLGVANTLGAREAKPSESGRCTDLLRFLPKWQRGEAGHLSLKWNIHLLPPPLQQNFFNLWFHCTLIVMGRLIHLFELQLFIWEKMVMTPKSYCAD